MQSLPPVPVSVSEVASPMITLVVPAGQSSGTPFMSESSVLHCALADPDPRVTPKAKAKHPTAPQRVFMTPLTAAISWFFMKGRQLQALQLGAISVLAPMPPA
jgi:hypothetical protein